MNVADTIVAIATPPGRGGIGVVRLSGPRSLDIARSLVRDRAFAPAPNRATLRNLVHPETRQTLDHALVTYFRAPHSFTGEEVVELSCHGSPVLLRQLLDCALSLEARLAGPGEFTLRALAHGRINLSQAEAVRDLINAQTQAAAQQAARQLNGELSAQLQPMKDALVRVIVQLESALEFVEDDLPELANENLKSEISDLKSRISDLAATFRTGRLFRDGLRVALAGRPNAGKSSLFNALLNSERAIVTDLPGTTRDTLSEHIVIVGIPVQLTDTAGLRESTELIESIGIERTRRAMSDADLVVVVIDGAQPLNAEDREVLAAARERPHIIALNKSDLGNFNPQQTAGLTVSAKTGAGLGELRAAIVAPFTHAAAPAEGLLITDARHHDLLQRAHHELASSAQLLAQRASEELTLVGLHNALRYLGQITGETTTEDILTEIFSTFCIGK
jgi:tRNA modification GTPase